VADVPKRCGGALLRHSREGHGVYIACLSFGETKESPNLWKVPGMTVERAREVKRREGCESSKILEAEFIAFDWGDSPLVVDEKRLQTVAELLRRIKPQIVVTHWVLSLYDDHRATAEAVIKASEEASNQERLRETGLEPWAVSRICFFEPEIGRIDVTRFTPDFYVDISDVFEGKMRALEPFVSQTAEEMEYYRVAAEYCGRQVGVKYAERYAVYRPQRLYTLIPTEG